MKKGCGEGASARRREEVEKWHGCWYLVRGTETIDAGRGVDVECWIIGEWGGQFKWMLCRRKRPYIFCRALLGLDIWMLLLIPGEPVLRTLVPCIFYSCHLPAIQQ